jgi:Holliday junction resolvasome RuvABC endonuclease subunit
MKILSLDMGTTAGWALREPSGAVSSGVWAHRTPRQARFEGGGMRFLRFRKNLEEIFDLSNGLDLVVYEEVRGHLDKAVDAAHVYGGFLAVLGDFCERKGVPYEGVPVGTIKRHATGKGNASKYGVINSVRKRGHQPLDDNEADALAIMYWALDEYAYLL